MSRQTRSRRLPADVAACSFWCNSGSGRTLELGPHDADVGGRRRGASYGVIDNSLVDIRCRWRAQRRALAPTFRAGVMLLFIPWRGGAARRQAHGRSADKPARAGYRPTSPLVLFGVIPDRGERWSSGRTMLTSAAAGAVRATGSSTTAWSTSAAAGGSAACSLAPTFPAGEWCSLSLGGGRRRVWRGASRPARAAWVGRRLPTKKRPSE